LAFGSRLKQTHHASSDLDLAVVGKEKLSFSTVGRLKEDFMESDIPYKIDILDYHAVSPGFREIIDRHCEVF
jgi:predicted nucleotidyltransferase